MEEEVSSLEGSGYLRRVLVELTIWVIVLHSEVT